MDTIPAEILNNILRQLCRPGRYHKFHYGDLNNSCFVSKLFRTVAQPILFEGFSSPTFFRIPEMSNFSQEVPLRCFLRVLINRPDLARVVKHIRIKEIVDCPASHGYRLWTTWKEEQDAELSRFSYQFWESPESDREEALWREIILLLYLAPNVKTLAISLGIYPNGMHKAFESRREDISDKYQFLPHLHSFEWVAGLWSDVMQFLPLPNLKVIQALGFEEEGKEYQDDGIYQPLETYLGSKLMSIQHIDFTEIEIEDTDLNYLVTHCEHLMSLRLRYGHYGDETVNDNVDFKGLGKALQMHRHTLESLKIETMFRPLTEGHIDLSEMQTLRVLQIPQIALIWKRWNDDFLSEDENESFANEPPVEDPPVEFQQRRLSDLLPRSLEDLEIEYCSLEILTHAEELLEVIKVKFPQLKRFKLRSPRRDRLEHDPRWTQLRSGYRENGVQFQIADESDSKCG